MAAEKRKNIVEYGLDLFLWSFCISNLYSRIMFRILPGWTLTGSRRLFWISWLIVTLLCLLLTPRRDRSTLAVFSSVNIHAAIFFLISYRDLYPRLVLTTWILLALCGGIYTSLVLIGYLQAGKDARTRSSRQFLLYFLHRLRLVSGTILSLVFCGFFLLSVFGSSLVKTEVPATDPREVRHTIADNMDTILLLREDQWARLSARERMDVFQTIANIEASHLGLPHELNVTAELLDENILALYDDSLHRVAVNANYLMELPAEAFVHAIAHEAYHAYEHRLVDLFDRTDPQTRNLMIFNRIRTYREELLTYVQPEDDFYAYDSQSVELDSDAYGEDAVEEYFGAIFNHITSNP